MSRGSLKYSPNRNIAQHQHIHDLLTLFGDTTWNSKDYFISDGRIFPNIYNDPFRSNNYAVFVCTEGSVKIKLNLLDYDLKPGSFVATTPSTICQLLKKSPSFRARILLFNKAFLLKNNSNIYLLEMLNLFGFNSVPCFRLKKEDSGTILSLLQNLRKNATREHPFLNEIMRGLILSFLYEAAGIYQKYHTSDNKRPNRKEDIYIKFHNLLAQYFKEERAVQFYADQLFVTPKYLTETIKEVSGKTTGELIDEVVILEAKVLLKNPELSIAQVAQTLHFSDQAFFAKFFKKRSGCSPGAYRKEF